MKTIVLKFSGPLQSWGKEAHFENRHTYYYPSKSAVIGIISACLGYRRYEDDKIGMLNNLDFAVRIDQKGNIIRDYHIARKYKKNGDFDRTYVSNRYYLEDAVFVVAVSHKDDNLMHTIEYGLRNQYFQAYMGRRSIPLSADFMLKFTDENIIDSIKSIPWQASDWYKKTASKTLQIYADANLISSNTEIMRRDCVLSFSQKNRQFGFRNEANIQMHIDSNSLVLEHDAFSALGD